MVCSSVSGLGFSIPLIHVCYRVCVTGWYLMRLMSGYVWLGVGVVVVGLGIVVVASSVVLMVCVDGRDMRGRFVLRLVCGTSLLSCKDGR